MLSEHSLTSTKVMRERNVINAIVGNDMSNAIFKQHKYQAH